MGDLFLVSHAEEGDVAEGPGGELIHKEVGIFLSSRAEEGGVVVQAGVCPGYIDGL